MAKKRVGVMLGVMKLAKIVRELAGLKPWVMYKRLGKKSVQAYLSLERSAKRISLEDLYGLEDIWIEEKCGSREDFHAKARSLIKKKR